MLTVDERSYDAMAIPFLAEKVRAYVADSVPSFARLPREDQRTWVAMAMDDSGRYDLSLERAPATILLTLWSLGIETLGERPELEAPLLARDRPEGERLDELVRRTKATIGAAY